MPDRQLDQYREIVDRIGQAEVARQTGLSASTINMVYHDKYQAAPDAVISAVLEKIGGVKMEQIPDGFMKDGQGRLVPREMIREIDIARDELVTEIIGKAQAVSRAMSVFKAATMDDISAFVDLAAERYGAALGGKKGNVTLRSFDHRYKIQLAVAEYLVFDEGLQAAKALIDELIHEWSAGSRDEIRTLVNDAFQVDKEGRIATGRVLGLRRLKIDDQKWKRAMDAISDSLTVAGSKSYVRIYERVGESDRYRQINLDMAAI